MSIKLLGNTTRVEAPFISVKIGNYTFGTYSKEKGGAEYSFAEKYRYPNNIESLSIVKLNGSVNTYTLNMKYQITAGDDPNFLDKVFSSVSGSRRMIISYGDCSSPMYMYKEEGATITDVRQNLDLSSSSISYTITAISDALTLQAGTFSFGSRTMKPSDKIKELLYNNIYGMLDVFYGMRDKELVMSKNLIAGDDKPVKLEAKTGVTIWDYLNYLVLCMQPSSDNQNSNITGARYVLTVNDDYSGVFGGPYFQVFKLETSQKQINSLDTYEIDIGFPCIDAVSSFSIDDDQTYSILYNYSKKMNQSDYVYRINNDGMIESLYSPSISNNVKDFKTTQADKTWWTQVTQYPVKATLTVKGLLRPSMLMSYIKINTYFYGQKHSSSGLYTITKQTDNISKDGFKTTLSLIRIGGDSEV